MSGHNIVLERRGSDGSHQKLVLAKQDLRAVFWATLLAAFLVCIFRASFELLNM